MLTQNIIWYKEWFSSQALLVLTITICLINTKVLPEKYCITKISIKNYFVVDFSVV